MLKTAHFQNRLVVQAIHQKIHHNWLKEAQYNQGGFSLKKQPLLTRGLHRNKQIKALQLKILKNKNNIIDYPLWPLSSYVDTWSSISDHLNHVMDSLFLYNLTAVPKALMTQMCCSTKSGYKNKYAFQKAMVQKSPCMVYTNGY